VQKPVYFDNHATTAVDPRVLDAMLPYFGAKFGNPASRSHSFGWEAEKAVEFARKRVTALAGAGPREIVFTSGATESNNLALKGAVEASRAEPKHIVTAATEHRAVLDPAQHLERQHTTLTVLPPLPNGMLELDRLASALRDDSILVSVMWANNEIGTLQPIGEIGALCRRRGILFHSDAAQALGRVPIQVNNQNIDLMSLTAHKIYGPKGIGALYVRRAARSRILAQLDGGGHEFGLRSGTLNVPAIVGFGAAAQICAQEMKAEAERVRQLRDRLQHRLLTDLDGAAVNGSIANRLPNNLNIRFAEVDASAILTSLPDVALSSGSACSSASPQPSHVLRAIGLSDAAARSSIRFGLGRFNTAEEIEFAAGRVVETVQTLRQTAPGAARG